MDWLIPTAVALILWSSPLPAAEGSPARFDRLAPLLDRSTFVPFSEEAVAASRTILLRALSRAPGGIAPDDWEYLRTDEVAQAIRAESELLNEYLDNLIAKLSQDYSPYENPGLVELRRATRYYRVVLENRQRRGEIEEAFERAKGTMRDALARYEQTGAVFEYDRLAEGVRWCDLHEQAREFVRAAREELSSPNLEIRLPADLIRTATQQQTTPETEPINRNSEGIQTIGTTDIRGRWYLEPIPAVGGGLLLLQFQGEVRFSAVNTRRRIWFSSNGFSQVSAVAQVAIDDRPSVLAAVIGVDAATGVSNSRASVDQCLFRRPVGRLADRVIARKTPEVEADLTREVREGASTKLKSQLDEMTAKANSFVQDVFLARARRLDLTPRFAVATTERLLRLGLTEDIQCGLAAPGSPPALGDGSGSAAIHQSLATDLLNVLYVRKKQPRKVDVNSFQLLKEALEETLPDGPFRDAEVREKEEVALVLDLDFSRPFRVTFADGLFSLTMRARELRLKDEILPTHDLTIDYQVSVHPDGSVRFIKLGDPRVSPLEAGVKVMPELVAAVRDELFANLSPGFKIDIDDLIGGKMPMPLSLRGMMADRGWLVGTIGAQQESSSRLPNPQTNE